MSTENQAPETAPAVAPTTEAAPVQQPAAAPTAGATPEKEPVTQPEVPEYEPTGDPGLDYALSFISRAGIAPDDPALVAAAEGDFGLLEAVLAQKGISGWEQAVALGKQAQQRLVEEKRAQAQAVEDAVLGVASAAGADWDKVATWAREHADESEVETINSFFAAGPFAAKIAATYLINSYQTATGTLAQPPAKAAVSANAVPAPTTPSAGQGPITRRELADAANTLYRQYGDSYMQRPEYQALVRRLAR